MIENILWYEWMDGNNDDGRVLGNGRHVTHFRVP